MPKQKVSFPSYFFFPPPPPPAPKRHLNLGTSMTEKHRTALSLPTSHGCHYTQPGHCTKEIFRFKVSSLVKHHMPGAIGEVLNGTERMLSICKGLYDISGKKSCRNWHFSSPHRLMSENKRHLVKKYGQHSVHEGGEC